MHHEIQATTFGTYLIWEDILVVQDVLGPVHQSIDVLWGWKFGRLFVLDPVFPQVLVPTGRLEMDMGTDGGSIPRACRHNRALIHGAELQLGPVDISYIPLAVYKTRLLCRTAYSSD